MNKLALGTVQFGLDYGINNKVGKVPESEVFAILDYAKKIGINTLDTASSYGESEKVLGQYFVKRGSDNLQIVSKFAEAANVLSDIKTSLQNLKTNRLYAYLLHHFESLKQQPDLYKEMVKLREEGLTQKIGFSLYYPHELQYLLDRSIPFDLVQVPYNIFDQRFLPYFAKLKKEGKEIHVRSAFLQGLIFKNPSDIPPYLQDMKKKLEKLHQLSLESEIPLAAMALNFCTSNPYIGKVVIGVDSLKNLQDNFSDLSHQQAVVNLISELLGLREDNEELILPINWK